MKEDDVHLKLQRVMEVATKILNESGFEASNCDVAVIGGGPIASVYAAFLKLARPSTKIVILERQCEPIHKIGESTLSGFCKALRTIGISKDAMRSLFFLKNGLGFLHIGDKNQRLENSPEYILESFDETYQVERRVLDTLLLQNARHLGIRVQQGAQVDVKKSQFASGDNIVAYSIGERAYRLSAKLVVDASGPRGLLAREFKLWTSDGLPFQTSAVWGYFRGLNPLANYTWQNRSQNPRDQYTEHLCLKEGWLWHIPIVSWRHVPTSNLTAGLDACLSANTSVPSRQQLSAEYGCPSEKIVSIGLVVRSDRDKSIKENARETFENYRRKYSAIRELLDGGELIDDPYGTGQTLMQRLSFRGYARKVCGNGWLLVGDAAFFVDPLISPGLTGGTAQAYRAAVDSARALDSAHLAPDAFADYEQFVHELHGALERDNQLVYMSFNHPAAMQLIQRLQEIDARKHFLENKDKNYSLEDTNVWGILSPAYQRIQQSAWKIMRDAELAVADVPIEEQSSADYAPMVDKLQLLLADYVQNNDRFTPYAVANQSLALTPS